jgi:hypothetical protein
MAPGGNLVRRAGRSRLRAKKGAIEQLYTAPPEGSVVVCLDEMGPQPRRKPIGANIVGICELAAAIQRITVSSPSPSGRL